MVPVPLGIVILLLLVLAYNKIHFQFSRDTPFVSTKLKLEAVVNEICATHQ